MIFRIPHKHVILLCLNCVSTTCILVGLHFVLYQKKEANNVIYLHKNIGIKQFLLKLPFWLWFNNSDWKYFYTVQWLALWLHSKNVQNSNPKALVLPLWSLHVLAIYMRIYYWCSGFLPPSKTCQRTLLQWLAFYYDFAILLYIDDKAFVFIIVK